MCAKMCFKIGKYLLERSEYKNAMIRLAFSNMKPDDTVTLIVSFGNSGLYDKENMKFVDIIREINDACMKADSLPGEIKNALVQEFIDWRDNELPEMIEEERADGKHVLEPEMDEVTFELTTPL